MPTSSLHTPTGRWLTTFGREMKQGDTPCLSMGHPLLGGEFTTYRLAAPVATSPMNDEPMFDLDEADIQLAGEWSDSGEVWATRAEIAAAVADHPRRLELKGLTFERSTFGQYRVVPKAAA